MKIFLRFVCVCLWLIKPSFSFGMSDLTNIRIIPKEASTQIEFALTHPTKQHIFTLTNPHRIVLDFDETRLVEYLKNLDLPTTEIQSIRSGFPKRHTLRLVLETKSPVNYQISPTCASKRFKLKIFRENNIGIKRIFSPKIIEKQAEHHTIVIVIDAGHGGKDPGAIGIHGIKEKDVVLAIAKKLAELLNQKSNVRVALTRSHDYFVPLKERLKLARKGKADLFISIHADSYFNNQANGASIYALSERGATTVAAKWLAQRENYSELGGVDLDELKDQSPLLRSVLIDLAQTSTTLNSLRLGTSLLDSLDNVTQLHYTRVEKAPFMVLKSPDIPSILVEIGFISNAHEELRLHNKTKQDELAKALYDGINAYLKKYPITG